MFASSCFSICGALRSSNKKKWEAKGRRDKISERMGNKSIRSQKKGGAKSFCVFRRTNRLGPNTRDTQEGPAFSVLSHFILNSDAEAWIRYPMFAILEIMDRLLGDKYSRGCSWSANILGIKGFHAELYKARRRRKNFTDALLTWGYFIGKAWLKIRKLDRSLHVAEL